jgi:hypothetical protein
MSYSVVVKLFGLTGNDDLRRRSAAAATVLARAA